MTDLRLVWRFVVKEVSVDWIDAGLGGTAGGERRKTCETFAGAEDVPRARRFAAEVVAQWGGGDPDVLALVVSELVTNAVAHGGGSCELRLVPEAGFVRIEVTDRVPVAPVVEDLDVENEGGRGMFMVNALASAWGVDLSSAGKTVWAQVSR